MPDALSDETAAQLIAMPLSALMLLEFLDVKAGHWIVQNTANGAVGKALAMLAAARGVHTVNLVRRDAGVGELTDVGITHAVSTASEGWQQKVHAITAGAPISAAVDSVGGRASGELLALLGEGGTLVSFGAMSAEPMQISPGDLIFKQATVKGFWGSKISQGLSVENKHRLIGELFKRAISGELQLPVEATYSLSDAAKAAAASLLPGRKGKVLLRP
jgi:NADPH:quinone reductase-like Zn-dependent oxidoreductase